MIRTTIGDFEVLVLSDGTYELDGGAFFGVVPKVLWEKRVQPDARNMLKVGTNSLLVRDGKQTALIETGIGSKLSEKQQSIHKNQVQLMKSFERAGVAPDEVDIVINTHLHFDHCGWNTVRRGDQFVATFSKASYYVQAGEWRHGRRQLERDAISYISANYDPLVANEKMQLLHGDQDIVPGISVKVFAGHTRHMQAVFVQSAGKTACYISDLIPTTAHLDLTWVMAFDLFPLETIESRKRFYSQAIPETWLTLFTHDPNVPWAYLQRDEQGKLEIAR